MSGTSHYYQTQWRLIQGIFASSLNHEFYAVTTQYFRSQRIIVCSEYLPQTMETNQRDS